MTPRPRSARTLAQAKVNLVLHVLAREGTGFHQLETLFLRLALGDGVAIRITSGGIVLDARGDAMPAEGLGPTEKNLAYRAARAYQSATQWPPGCQVEIDKRIPVGGGLGGGSADAGAVLRILDALSPHPLGERLIELATSLGADVPFLTTESPFALGWGRGERLLPLPAPPQRTVVLAFPSFGVGTAEAYGWLAASRGNESQKSWSAARSLGSVQQLGEWETLARLSSNDFEGVVDARHPGLARIRGALAAAGARVARMSGSGSTVFGVFEGQPAPGGLSAVHAEGARTVVTRSADSVVAVEFTD
ncbi:MAG: 4-diphosphocytidyl-2-C-methyl-D-erythritol kinase [Gemmatimonadetes bacterium]|nr:4-diphosphocytidyl-2-C-methyl-D-erythritol kinase [Gemmatimonadota bacterium]